jgi:hypothetical protein
VECVFMDSSFMLSSYNPAIRHSSNYATDTRDLSQLGSTKLRSVMGIETGCKDVPSRANLEVRSH